MSAPTPSLPASSLPATPGSITGPATSADFDRRLRAWQSRFTDGHSPSTVGLAFIDWAAHAANAPFQTAELLQYSFTQ
ncbi:MAG: poly-beta-hydroxybutyrate polymerase N-terminal domain-containing protein [Janthinobacterium lividum]